MIKRILGELTGIRPNFLGRRFRLGSEPEIYIGRGFAGDPIKVVLQAESTGEIKKVTKKEFEKLATRADE